MIAYLVGSVQGQTDASTKLNRRLKVPLGSTSTQPIITQPLFISFRLSLTTYPNIRKPHKHYPLKHCQTPHTAKPENRSSCVSNCFLFTG